MVESAATRAAAAFARGDYHSAAEIGPADCWQRHAALALCGNIAPGLAGLAKIDCPEARFYEGVAAWLAGDEDTAIERLRGVAGALAPEQAEHAANLLRLIEKPQISVLGQLPWRRFGPHTILVAAEYDPKFRYRNISFHPDDLACRPYADIHDYYDPSDPPDFYISEMLEWHMVPPNIQELPCPILGHTADFDLHIQMLYPWLRLCDDVLVTDKTEHAAVTGLVEAPIFTVPKAFALPWTVPEPYAYERQLDLVLTGSLFHNFWPEKTDMIHQMLAVPELKPFFLNGFMSDTHYFLSLARSKFSISCLRHPGATPTRGLETLAMGATLLAQSETVLRLWLDENQGLLTYDLADGSLRRAVETVLGDPARCEARAREGMAIIRREFDPWKVGAHYLRMATFIAARPRGPRKIVEPAPDQKRPVLKKGWLPHNYEGVLRQLQTINLQKFRERPMEAHTVATLNDTPRELLLEYAYQAQKPFTEMSEDKLLPVALNMYQAGITAQPDSLAIRFNYIRTCFHFGSETDIARAEIMVKSLLETDPAHWQLDPLDDVMPWDFCQDFFNYRGYFRTVTETLAGRLVGIPAMKDMIYASLHYYYGRMAERPDQFAAAARLDPAFPVYRLWQAKQLAAEGDTEAVAAAADILRDLAKSSMYAIEAWALLQALAREHGIDLAADAAIRRGIETLENHTLLNEDYLTLRYSAYFRSQRLGLARSRNVEIRHRRADRPAETPQLSILLADTNGSRYATLCEALAKQTLPRDSVEIICVDVFDRPSPAMMETADLVMVCGQNEYLHNRNVAFNFAAIASRAPVLAIIDSDADLAPDAMEGVVKKLNGAGRRRLALANKGANQGGNRGADIDRHHLHVLALKRDDLILSGGLDETAFRAGPRSGPYELALRLHRRSYAIEAADGIAPPSPEAVAALDDSLGRYLQSVYPERYSPMRAEPSRMSPEIEALRDEML